MKDPKKVVSLLTFLSQQKNTHNNRGQSTVEFIATFTFVVGFIFLFIKFAVNITNGFVVHYGSYMASRAYLSFEEGSADANATDARAAQIGADVFSDLKIERFIGNTSLNISFNSPTESGKAIYQGASVSFSQSLGVFKAIGGNQSLNLRSDSFLGREPPRAECIERICDAMEGEGLGADCGGDFQTLFDNGC